MKTFIDCAKSGLHLTDCDNDGFCNNCGHQETPFYYEIHVTGKNGFSTTVISDVELDDDDVIMLGYEQDKLEGDDCHHVDYVNELSFEEWDEQFNFNNLKLCDNCGNLFTKLNSQDICSGCNATNEHSSFMNGGK